MKQLCFHRHLLLSSLNPRDNFMLWSAWKSPWPRSSSLSHGTSSFECPQWVTSDSVPTGWGKASQLQSSWAPLAWVLLEHGKRTCKKQPCPVGCRGYNFIYQTEPLIQSFCVSTSPSPLVPCLQYPCDYQGNFCKHSRDSTADCKGSQTCLSLCVCLLFHLLN